MRGEKLNLLRFNYEEKTNVNKAWIILFSMEESLLSAAKNRNDDDDDEKEDDEDYYNEEEEENPFDKEPTEKDLIDEDIPLIDPEEDMLDDDDEVPYN